MFRVGRISVRFPGKLLLALTVLVTVSIVLTRPAAAWDETFSKNLATTVLGMGCSDVNSYATTTDLATNMLKAIPDTATPAGVGMSSENWDKNSSIIDQIKADPSIIGTASARSTTQCADLAKLLRYGNSLSQGGTPTPQPDANSWLAKLQTQIDPLKSGWIDTICKDSLDTGCRAQAEQTIAQLANACSVVDEINRTPTTIKSYDDLKNCANKNNDYLKSQKDACSGTDQKWDDATNTCITTSTDPTNSPAQCAGGALGWMLCPLVDVFTDVINTTAGFLNNLLFISPIGSNTSLQSIWGTFVGIANLLLVVAFLVVIFSQATSIGLSAYGIKKMLPRIIAAALLINLSYFICTIALDITNIIGGTVGGMVQSFIPNGSTLSDTTVLQRSDSWASWIKVALAASVVGAIAAAVGAIAFIVPLLLSAAFAVLSIFLVVILRQVIVILLIIIAPLAFAAMVLPNTESLFTKWQKTFVNMLVMYPVIMFILYGSQLVGALILASKSAAASGTAWIFDLSSVVAMTAAPAGGLYMYIANQNKLMNMMTGGISKLAKAARKSTTGWAKEKQGNSRFARAREWNKSLKEANRIERQGKMTGFQGALNKGASIAAGASLNPADWRNWRSNAGKYQASAVNRAAIEADKIFKEDKGNAAAEYAKNGIGGPLMVEHARSGRVVKQNADGSYTYGRKLTEAEHSAAVEWTMANGKLAERQAVYGSDWAAKGRTPEYSRALDTMNDGYFHVNKDVARFGNKFGGSMTSGSVGGDLGVDNAAFLNMASGKTSAEAIIDNDMAQTLANLSALSDTDLATRFKDLVPKELSDQGVTPDQYVAMFRANVKQSAETVFDTRELNAKVKPEFAGALKELAKLQAPDAKRLKDAAAQHAKVQANKAKIDKDGGQDEISKKIDSKLTTIQPAPPKGP